MPRRDIVLNEANEPLADAVLHDIALGYEDAPMDVNGEWYEVSVFFMRRIEIAAEYFSDPAFEKRATDGRLPLISMDGVVTYVNQSEIQAFLDTFKRRIAVRASKIQMKIDELRGSAISKGAVRAELESIVDNFV